MSVLLRESCRITLYIHLKLVQSWRFVWEGLQYLTGFDQVLLLSTLCEQVRDEAQAQSKSLTSSSAVAVSMVVAAFLLDNPFSFLMSWSSLKRVVGGAPASYWEGNRRVFGDIRMNFEVFGSA